jgi:inosine-uridine nucleoside N-ribohydrolase
MARRKFILDMDVGIDDAIALIYLAAEPEVDIVALGSIHGNIDAPQAALNALRVLEVCGLETVPVAVGAERPLVRDLALATHVHGDDGLGNTAFPLPRGRPTGEHAADQLVRLAHAHPGECDLLAVGPLTNLALGLQHDPLLLTRFRSVVIMGGTGPEPEPDVPLVGYDANIDHDPEAAERVFAAPGPRVMVGINVTIPTVLTGAALAQVESTTTAHGRFAWQILQCYLDVYERRLGYRGCSMHDPLAAGIALTPNLITACIDGPVEVVPTERGYRALLRRVPQDPQRPTTQVVTTVDGQRYLARLTTALTSPLWHTTPPLHVDEAREPPVMRRNRWSTRS